MTAASSTSSDVSSDYSLVKGMLVVKLRQASKLYCHLAKAVMHDEG